MPPFRFINGEGLLRTFVGCRSFHGYPAIFAVAVFLVVGSLPDTGGLGATTNDPSAEDLLQVGDEAYSRFDNAAALAAYAKAVARDSSNCEALWKLGRAHIDVGKASKDPRQTQHYFLGERITRRCVALYPESAQGHFFLAAALGRVALKVGGKEKIRLSKEIKAEAERTLELNPQHDGAMHIIGRWHYELGTLSWVLKSFAKLIYGGLPPDGGIESAVFWLKKAVAAAPAVPMHHLWLGKALVELKRYDEARAHLEMCLSLPKFYWDDEEHKELARSTLKDIAGKNHQQGK